MKTVPAAEFKARCLALMDQVHETGQSLVITKHGNLWSSWFLSSALATASGETWLEW